MTGRLFKLAVSYIGVAILVLLGFLLVFIVTAEEIREKDLDKFDSIIIGFIQGFVSPNLTEVMLFFTMLGSILWITSAVIAAMAIFFWKKHWRIGLFIGLSSGVGSLFNIILKTLLKRQRPDIQPLIQEQGFSFPSGHSMGSFIFYGSLAFLIFHYIKKKSLKWTGTLAMVLLIFLIGISRIYLGVHYPTDVVGGFTAGGAWLTVCIILLNYYEKRKNTKKKMDSLPSR